MGSDTEAQAALMDRREAVKRVSFLLGGIALVGSGSGLLTACTKDRAPAAAAGVGTFTTGDVAFLDEVADTILPDTAKSPGAKAAKTGAFMALMVTDTYTPEDQKVFRDGMTALDDASKKVNGGLGFMAATPAQRTAVLESLDKEQHAFQSARKPDQAQHYFRMMKELTMLGFFTSEIGYTKAMRYVESPGRYDPCVTIEPGSPSWASHA
jgi:hypothetical protein